MARLLWICLGGAVGTAARYLLSDGLFRITGQRSYGTLAVNVIGSFLLGLIVQFFPMPQSEESNLRLALTTGLMGGFTTYSTFNQETLGFFREEAWGLGLAYLAVTVIACLLAGLLGVACGRWLAG